MLSVKVQLTKSHYYKTKTPNLFCDFSLNVPGFVQRRVYSRKELDYAFFVHSLCVLGKLLIYTNGRKLFPIKLRKHKGVTLDLTHFSTAFYPLQE